MATLQSVFLFEDRGNVRGDNIKYCKARTGTQVFMFIHPIGLKMGGATQEITQRIIKTNTRPALTSTAQE